MANILARHVLKSEIKKETFPWRKLWRRAFTSIKRVTLSVYIQTHFHICSLTVEQSERSHVSGGSVILYSPIPQHNYNKRKKETKVPWLPWQSCLLHRQRIIPLNLPVTHMCQPLSWALCESGTQSSCNLSRCVIFQAWLVERLACLVPIKDEAKFTITHPERARTHTHKHKHARVTGRARALSFFAPLRWGFVLCCTLIKATEGGGFTLVLKRLICAVPPTRKRI